MAIENFFRIRALVDSCSEEMICRGVGAEAAMQCFAETPDPDSGGQRVMGDHGIDVAMVHRIKFSETGPIFEDVTYQLSDKWARADFDQCMNFIEKAGVKNE